MKIIPRAGTVLLAIFSWACRAEFIDDRPQGAPLIAEAQEDLRGADLFGLKIGTLAQGTVMGRDGHLGVGGASLFRLDDGHVELRFDDLFQVSQVQGPLVVLTSRDTLGTTLDPGAGDLLLGTLKQFSGQQAYPVRGGGGTRRYAFVYCQPYGVEVARAPLVDVP